MGGDPRGVWGVGDSRVFKASYVTGLLGRGSGNMDGWIMGRMDRWRVVNGVRYLDDYRYPVFQPNSVARYKIFYKNSEYWNRIKVGFGSLRYFRDMRVEDSLNSFPPRPYEPWQR
jgi:hypothetical protein